MTSVHLHLLLTHVPVISVIVGTILLIWALIRKSDEIRNVALAIFVGAALIAIPVLRTGHGAEEAVEGQPGVTESVIEEHEEAATTTFWTAEALGAISLIMLVMGARRANTGKLVYVPLILSLVTSGMLAWTANLGGMIRHTEIRSGTAATAPAGGGQETGDND